MALDLDGLAIFLQFFSYRIQHGNNKTEGKQSKKAKAKFDLSLRLFLPNVSMCYCSLENSFIRGKKMK